MHVSEYLFFAMLTVYATLSSSTYIFVEALDAYDTFVIQRKGKDVLPTDLNRPDKFICFVEQSNSEKCVDNDESEYAKTRKRRSPRSGNESRPRSPPKMPGQGHPTKRTRTRSPYLQENATRHRAPIIKASPTENEKKESIWHTPGQGLPGLPRWPWLRRLQRRKRRRHDARGGRSRDNEGMRVRLSFGTKHRSEQGKVGKDCRERQRR